MDSLTAERNLTEHIKWWNSLTARQRDKITGASLGYTVFKDGHRSYFLREPGQNLGFYREANDLISAYKMMPYFTLDDIKSPFYNGDFIMVWQAAIKMTQADDVKDGEYEGVVYNFWTAFSVAIQDEPVDVGDYVTVHDWGRTIQYILSRWFHSAKNKADSLCSAYVYARMQQDPNLKNELEKIP